MILKGKASDRFKRRYLLIESIDKEEIERAILDYLGVLGWAKASPFFVEQRKEKIILAVERKSLNDVRAAFELSPVKIKIIKVSGTLKGLGKRKL